MFSKSDFRGIVNSMGLVFGDIGTSPIYTLTVIFLLTRPTEVHVIGVLSLIIWTLIILVTMEYAWLAMSLGKKGEGGTIVLKEILIPLLKSSRNVSLITILAYIGTSFLLGDGVITPAISILSAVEGVRIISGFENIGQGTLMLIASLIAIGLFSFQNKGSEKIAWAFGPIMVVWFLALAVSGIASIFYTPAVLKAINPYYAIDFLSHNGLVGFFVLSEVTLCCTGGEALYADMGHLGREPILKAWKLIFFALVFNYLGQGAFLIRNPDSKNVLFEMINHQAHIIFIPFLILSIIATIIASQAMISGVFSIVYQGITTRIMPMLKIDYTSGELKSQIYISAINWMLLISVLCMIFVFKESSKLAAAYGLAVTGTMTITGMLMTSIFYHKKQTSKVIISLFITFIDIVFLLSNTYKIPHGGYWSVIIAAVVFALIVIYTSGQKKLYELMKPAKFEDFLEKYNKVYTTENKISGTALFFSRDINRIPQYISHVMFRNNIIYENNIFISIIKSDSPFGVESSFTKELAKGLRLFEIKMGYMEIIDVEQILKDNGVTEKTIFYGIEDIFTSNLIWKTFSVIKKLSPSFVQFYRLPADELHGVMTRFEM
ncbi:potassium transporter Kup [Methanosarcina sp. 2.H.T.1A.6]|uniref:KUP/HAK/KT family potassium transporter n=1 Tax=unclassified Methanosarcina TaxID=2644672 RepID=UPI0006222409|nr:MULTISPECIES: KUP/HAK/KT family potassium transporter [unclassified Methanosarcina]KKG15589.1 potassium transporter Kup [Methanosarcina sp. 2.H.T.1A.15]KKG17592.1 potassium transporter Kup [Methanosarcina sp. 2.H.T.1A.3]KKG21832.1 potassium transporter Kup [Methanosarcina sp. 2.H.T.1A.6]KKG25367.1 potassium transporter Kup [Methanosarcina sp. 2.H.T.1A.8]